MSLQSPRSSGTSGSAGVSPNYSTNLSFYFDPNDNTVHADFISVGQSISAGESLILVGTTTPNTQTGKIYFDSGDNHFYGYNGTAWTAFTGP